MGYFSIAIIIFESKYLIIKNQENQIYEFPQFEDRALGAYFDFNKLINYLERILKLKEIRKYSIKEFVMDRGWEGKDKPPSTVYKFTFSEKLYRELSTSSSIKWIDIAKVNEIFTLNKDSWNKLQIWILERLQDGFRENNNPFVETKLFYNENKFISESQVPINVLIHNHNIDTAHAVELANFFKPLVIKGIVDIFKDPLPGENINEFENEVLNSFDIALFMLTSSYLSCDSCFSFMRKIQESDKRWIPILVKHCQWDVFFENIAILPKNLKPIVDKNWSSIDEAYNCVIDEFKALLK